MHILIQRREILSKKTTDRRAQMERQTAEFNDINRQINKLQNELNRLNFNANKLQVNIEKDAVKQMEEMAELRDVENQINQIPTLARQLMKMEKTKGLIKPIAAALIFLFFAFAGFAQKSDYHSAFYMAGEAGNGLGLNAGYTMGPIIQIGYDGPYTRGTRKNIINGMMKPHIFYGSVGYDFGEKIMITPAVGLASYTSTHVVNHDNSYDSTFITPLISLEIGKNFLIETGKRYYRVYMYARQAEKLFVGAGLKILIP